MGDYASIQVVFAESDFNPEEREFMAVLRERFFEPRRLISLSNAPGAYQAEQDLRKQVHADLGLPGTDGDWRFILSRNIDGQHYYLPIDSLPDTIIPPFPQRFARVPRLRKKYGILPIWYALFSTTNQQVDHCYFVSPIGEARKRFAENLEGVWQLLFAADIDEQMEALKAATAEGSAGRKSVLKVFDLFPFADYLAVLKLLAGDWGGNALIEFSFGEIAYSYGPNGSAEANKAEIQADFESAIRIFESLRRLDIAALIDEPLLQTTVSYNGAGIYPWLAAYEHIEPVRQLRQWLVPDLWE
jgi:hypothetical protein